MQNILRSSSLRLGALAAASALALTACGSADQAASSSASGSPAGSSTSAAASSGGATSGGSAAQGRQAESLSVVDPWTKATDGEMTGSFGTLRNDSDTPLHIVSVSSDAAPRTELHEMAEGADGQMSMRQAPDGLTVPAQGSLELVPGGNHIMLMDLTDPVEAGAEVAYTLTLEDGSTLEVTSVARPFTGANESYHGGEASSASGSDAHADH